MAESEAQRRVQAALSARAQAEQQYQDDWEAADKPTTVNGAGVVRQLGAQPLDARQLLSNTTAGAGVPIAGAAVPGGIVGDWVPRFREEVPVVRRKKSVLGIYGLFAVESDSDYGVSGFKKRQYWLYANGTYVELGEVGSSISEWRTGGEGIPIIYTLKEPGATTATATATPTANGGAVLQTDVDGAEGYNADARASWNHRANAARFSYSLSLEASSTNPDTSPRIRAISTGFNVAGYSFTTGYVQSLPGTDSNSVSESGTFTTGFDSIGHLWRVLSAVDVAGGGGFPPFPGYLATASGNHTISNVDLAYTPAWDGWTFTDGNNFVAWIYVTEDLRDTATALYSERRFYGWTGRNKNITTTKVYARRDYQNGTVTYAEGATDIELSFSTTPITPVDFFDNSKSWNLAWDVGSPITPCDAAYASTSENLHNEIGYQALTGKRLSIPLDYANGSGGDVDVLKRTAVVTGEACTLGDIETVTAAVKPYDGPEVFTSCESFSYYAA